MDNKQKLALKDHLLPNNRRKVFSGFGFLCIGASLIVLTILLVTNLLSSPSPTITPLFDQEYLSCAHEHTPKGVLDLHSHVRDDGGILDRNSTGNYTSKDDNAEKEDLSGSKSKVMAVVGESGLVDSKVVGYDPNVASKQDTVVGDTDHSGHKLESSSHGPMDVTGNSTSGAGGVGGRHDEGDDGGLGPDGECDVYDGKWVRDDSRLPYYAAGSCPFVDGDFNCIANGRPDDGFARWRWQPKGCDVPSLNASDFLERLRGKRMVFVGDSLNRNMWESLVCILSDSVRDKERVYEISGRREFKKKGFYAFRFEGYDCSIDFVGAPFLVRESTFRDKERSMETLRLDLMDRTTSMYGDADVIVFNTGHWWTHDKTSRGENYYQEGKHVHPRLHVLEAYRRALKTWARWVDKHIDGNRTRVFFRGYSQSHFSGGRWNSGGQCHKETEPIFNESYLVEYPSKMRVVEQVLQGMKTTVNYMNISRLTDYRKDGHPSIYRKVYKTQEERSAADSSQDCSHWCLPGVPDTWNELLYAVLKNSGWGSQ